MIDILSSLIPRKYEEGQIMQDELQHVLELNFVLKGAWRVGYEINKQKKYKLLFGEDTNFGGYGCLFNIKSMFIYKCAKPIEGYAIRKKKWS